MERILAHYVPNLSFDIQSLRKAAEELTSKHRDSQSEEPSTQADIDELEDLAIDDEDFTIKALPDNTTRETHRELAPEALMLTVEPPAHSQSTLGNSPI